MLLLVFCVSHLVRLEMSGKSDVLWALSDVLICCTHILYFSFRVIVSDMNQFQSLVLLSGSMLGA